MKIKIDLSIEQVLALLFLIETIEKTALTDLPLVNTAMQTFISALRSAEFSHRY